MKERNKGRKILYKALSTAKVYSVYDVACDGCTWLEHAKL